MRLSGRFSIGDTVRIVLKGVEKKLAKVVGKKVLKMKDINDYIAGLDTGYSVDETRNILKRMYKDTNWEAQDIYLYLLQTIKTNNDGSI